MRIAICTPVPGDTRPGYTRSLVHMCVATGRAAKSAPLMFEYLTAASPNPVFARTELVRAAKQIGADHLLWIDPDLTFPQDTLLRLIARRQRVIGANIVAKDTRLPTARAMDGSPLATNAEMANGRVMEECGAIGLGLAFMELKVFDEIEAPWFATGWDEAGAPVSEALHFSARLRAAGIPIHVDHGLSAKAGPVVDQILTHEGALAERIRDGVVRSRVGGGVPRS